MGDPFEPNNFIFLNEGGLKLKELAEAVGIGHYASLGSAIKLLERRSIQDARLAKFMSKAKRLLISEM